MAKQIIWTPEAIASFDNIISYLIQNWSDRDIRNFIADTENIIEFISVYPLMFRKTNKRNVREALISPHNILIYKIYTSRIDLIAFWDTRQHPRKKSKK